MTHPQTAFEQRNLDGRWTSFEEESDYLDRLLNEVPGVTKEVVGQGHTGLDINLLKVGTGSRSFFAIAQIHGNELSGRDALLSFIRDLALSEEPWILDYLSKVSVAVIPTSRPESMTLRNPAIGGNMNTDMFELFLPETQAVQTAATKYSPEVSLDLHEDAGNLPPADYGTAPCGVHSNVHPSISDLSWELDGAVRQTVEGLGYTWVEYKQNGKYLTRGHLTSNSYGLRHSVGLLMESRRDRTPNNYVETERRFRTQYDSLMTAISWHHQNLNRVQTAVEESKARTSEKLDVFYLDTTDVPSPVLTSPPTSYILKEDDIEDYNQHAEFLGLPSTEDGEVSTTNDGANILHYILNPLSGQKLFNATSHGEEVFRSIKPTRPEAYVMYNGELTPAYLSTR